MYRKILKERTLVAKDSSWYSPPEDWVVGSKRYRLGKVVAELTVKEMEWRYWLYLPLCREFAKGWVWWENINLRGIYPAQEHSRHVSISDRVELPFLIINLQWSTGRYQADVNLTLETPLRGQGLITIRLLHFGRVPLFKSITRHLSESNNATHLLQLGRNVHFRRVNWTALASCVFFLAIHEGERYIHEVLLQVPLRHACPILLHHHVVRPEGEEGD